MAERILLYPASFYNRFSEKHKLPNWVDIIAVVPIVVVTIFLLIVLLVPLIIQADEKS